jgi:hypothetical protein
MSTHQTGGVLAAVKATVVRIRETLFKWRLEWEIYHRIAPHIHLEETYEYPFGSEAELRKNIIQGDLDAQLHLETIKLQADLMGKAYGEAFRYIVYRDLNARMQMYLKLVQTRVPSQCRIPAYAS